MDPFFIGNIAVLSPLMILAATSMLKQQVGGIITLAATGIIVQAIGGCICIPARLLPLRSLFRASTHLIPRRLWTLAFLFVGGYQWCAKSIVWLIQTTWTLLPHPLRQFMKAACLVTAMLLLLGAPSYLRLDGTRRQLRRGCPELDRRASAMMQEDCSEIAQAVPNIRVTLSAYSRVLGDTLPLRDDVDLAFTSFCTQYVPAWVRAQTLVRQERVKHALSITRQRALDCETQISLLADIAHEFEDAVDEELAIARATLDRIYGGRDITIQGVRNIIERLERAKTFSTQLRRPWDPCLSRQIRAAEAQWTLAIQEVEQGDPKRKMYAVALLRRQSALWGTCEATQPMP